MYSHFWGIEYFPWLFICLKYYTRRPKRCIVNKKYHMNINISSESSNWAENPMLVSEAAEVAEYIPVNILMLHAVQPKSLSWWWRVSNSLIFQHSTIHGGSVKLQMCNRSKQPFFYSIALARIRTQHLWASYHILD